jgi:hypothetical protein
LTTLCFSAKGEGLLLPLSRVDVLAYGLVVKRCAVCVWFSHCAGRANPYDHQTPGTLSSIAIALASLTRTSAALRKSVACAGHPQRQGLHTLQEVAQPTSVFALVNQHPLSALLILLFRRIKTHGYCSPLHQFPQAPASSLSSNPGANSRLH